MEFAFIEILITVSFGSIAVLHDCLVSGGEITMLVWLLGVNGGIPGWVLASPQCADNALTAADCAE